MDFTQMFLCELHEKKALYSQVFKQALNHRDHILVKHIRDRLVEIEEEKKRRSKDQDYPFTTWYEQERLLVEYDRQLALNLSFHQLESKVNFHKSGEARYAVSLDVVNVYETRKLIEGD